MVSNVQVFDIHAPQAALVGFTDMAHLVRFHAPSVPFEGRNGVCVCSHHVFRCDNRIHFQHFSRVRRGRPVDNTRVASITVRSALSTDARSTMVVCRSRRCITQRS